MGTSLGTIFIDLKINLHALDEANRKIKNFTKTVNVNTKQANTAVKKMSKEFRRSFKRFGNEMVRVGLIITNSIGAIAKRVFTDTVGAASFDELEFVKLRKILPITDAEAKKLQESLREIVRIIPLTSPQISNVGAEAARLGVKSKHIKTFTEVMGKMSFATVLGAREAAIALARFSNIVKLPLEEIGRVGSAIVHLGNNFAANEREIAKMALRIGSLRVVAGATIPEILGLSAAFPAVGLFPELVGTSLTRIFIRLQNQVRQSKKTLKLMGHLTGKTPEEFELAWNEGQVETLFELARGLNAARLAGVSFADSLRALDLDGHRITLVMAFLAGNTALFEDAIQKANDAFYDHIALEREFQRFMNSLSNQFRLFVNQLNLVKLRLGEAFIEPIKEVVKFLTAYLIPVLEMTVVHMNHLSSETRLFIIAIIGILIALGPVIASLGVFLILLSLLGAKIIIISIALLAIPIALAFAVIKIKEIRKWMKKTFDFSPEGFGKFLEKAKNGILTFWKILKITGKVLWFIVKQTVLAIAEVGNQFLSGFKFVYGAIKPIVSSMWTIGKDIFRFFADWKKHIKGIGKFFTDLKDQIVGDLNAIFNKLKAAQKWINEKLKIFSTEPEDVMTSPWLKARTKAQKKTAAEELKLKRTINRKEKETIKTKKEEVKYQKKKIEYQRREYRTLEEIVGLNRKWDWSLFGDQNKEELKVGFFLDHEELTEIENKIKEAIEPGSSLSDKMQNALKYAKQIDKVFGTNFTRYLIDVGIRSRDVKKESKRREDIEKEIQKKMEEVQDILHPDDLKAVEKLVSEHAMGDAGTRAAELFTDAWLSTMESDLSGSLTEILTGDVKKWSSFFASTFQQLTRSLARTWSDFLVKDMLKKSRDKFTSVFGFMNKPFDKGKSVEAELFAAELETKLDYMKSSEGLENLTDEERKRILGVATEAYKSGRKTYLNANNVTATAKNVTLVTGKVPLSPEGVPEIVTNTPTIKPVISTEDLTTKKEITKNANEKIKSASVSMEKTSQILDSAGMNMGIAGNKMNEGGNKVEKGGSDVLSGGSKIEGVIGNILGETGSDILSIGKGLLAWAGVDMGGAAMGGLMVGERGPEMIMNAKTTKTYGKHLTALNNGLRDDMGGTNVEQHFHLEPGVTQNDLGVALTELSNQMYRKIIEDIKTPGSHLRTTLQGS